MKKILVLGAILTLLGACGDSGSKITITKTDTTPGIPSVPDEPEETNKKYLVEGNFEDENAYIVFTNQNANDTSYKDSVVIRTNSILSNPYMNIQEEIKVNEAFDPLKIREKELKSLEYLKNIDKTNILMATNTTTGAVKLEEVGTLREFNISTMDSNLNAVEGKKSFRLIKQVDLREATEKRALNIWIEKDENLTGAEETLLADSFLKPGENNDIYEYITNIYGREWYEVGETPELGLIEPQGTIDILLYKINQVYPNSKGNILGFYQGLDNIKVPIKTDAYYDRLKNSNERVMFHMDLDTFKNNQDSTISTLAHEFVHTIVFFQKMVLRGTAMDVWLNEMLAMVGEDLTANKLSLPGPRGIRDVNSSIPTSDEKNRYAGRFFHYNSLSTNSLPINEKRNFGVSNYSITFAYGAYLLRNIPDQNGNLDFIRNILANRYGDHRAIESAFLASGKALTFEESVKNFGKATLLSDNIFAEEIAYKYNVGRTFNHNGLEYQVGPINVHNYVNGGTTGFVSYGTNYQYAPRISGAVTQFFKLGDNLVGNKTFEITLPVGVDYEVVVKNSDNTYDFDKSQQIQLNVKEIK